MWLTYCIICKQDVGSVDEKMELGHRSFLIQDVVSPELQERYRAYYDIPPALFKANGSLSYINITYTICKSCGLPSNIEDILRAKLFVKNVNGA